MQLNTMIILASLAGAAVAAPLMPNSNEKAVINSRFIKYENEPRDTTLGPRMQTDDEKEAAINSRFIKYKIDERDNEERALDDSQEAAINSRFIKYEMDKRNGATS